MSRAVEAEDAGRWWALAAAVLHHACGSATLPAQAALHAWSAALACARGGAVPAARYESAARAMMSGGQACLALPALHHPL